MPHNILLSCMFFLLEFIRVLKWAHSRLHPSQNEHVKFARKLTTVYFPQFTGYKGQVLPLTSQVQWITASHSNRVYSQFVH